MTDKEKIEILIEALSICMPDLWEIDNSNLDSDKKKILHKAKEIMNEKTN